ncbi:MAG: DUF177 domain-containing protein [Bacteroidales bacterium]|nr:DUF177 domain-containing protein [Bacteroidales bacterium]
MDVLKDYKISFSGLQLGLHSFDIQISDQFFESFENSRVQHGKLSLKLDLSKQETMLQFDFHIKGDLQVECDRCLHTFTYPLEVNEMLIIKFGYESHEESESVLVISEKEYEIQLAQYIYEFIILGLPMQLVHPDLENGESACNFDSLEDFNEVESEDKKEMDPRWDALKKLIKD